MIDTGKAKKKKKRENKRRGGDRKIQKPLLLNLTSLDW